MAAGLEAALHRSRKAADVGLDRGKQSVVGAAVNPLGQCLQLRQESEDVGGREIRRTVEGAVHCGVVPAPDGGTHGSHAPEPADLSLRGEQQHSETTHGQAEKSELAGV